MQRFRNILVGIDLAQADRLIGEELAPPAAEAVARGMWLAKTSSARLRFFSTLDVSGEVQRRIEGDRNTKPSLMDQAADALAKLVARAAAEGIAADSRVVFGKSWLQIIRQVLKASHDLVVVGTRHAGPVKGFLVGSTAIKLLRKCPCPVWVAQPQPDLRIASILVAHDLRPVGDLAMELGCWLAQFYKAQLYVFHAVEYPQLDYLMPGRVSLDNAVEYRHAAEQHIAKQLARYDLSPGAQVDIVTQPPDFAILDRIDRHAIQLLVMGTIGRGGISGVITGNTAERLLPRIPCSVLAVKPEDFKSPVTIE